MKLLLKRISRKPDYTVGKLYLDGVYFCDTIEDVDRGLRETTPLSEIQRIKVMHKTAIPSGTYAVIVNMSPAKQRLLPRLLGVPGFEGILIHRGNTAADSSGCILLGENKLVGQVINSTEYENRLVDILKKESKITIEIC
ncbi:MAG: DUF5675 family protein [Prevotellaceae bacterium]|jgi:hypothetical protein|nr:DUF5675 family protein [Prevotellaceae bacterium]